MFNAEPYGFIQYIDDCAAGADVTYLFFELNYSVKGHVNTNFIARKEIRKQKKTRILKKVLMFTFLNVVENTKLVFLKMLKEEKKN